VCATYLISTHTSGTGALGQGTSMYCCPSPPLQATAFPLPCSFCSHKFDPSEGQASAKDCRFEKNRFSENVVSIYGLVPGGSAVVPLSMFGHF